RDSVGRVSCGPGGTLPGTRSITSSKRSSRRPCSRQVWSEDGTGQVGSRIETTWLTRATQCCVSSSMAQTVILKEAVVCIATHAKFLEGKATQSHHRDGRPSARATKPGGIFMALL